MKEAERSRFLIDMCKGLYHADSVHPPLNSAHEAYAVIAEELDEFWEHVKRKHDDRDLRAMREALIDIAVAAWRTARDLGIESRIRTHHLPSRLELTEHDHLS